MASLVELTAQIVAAHAGSAQLTSDELMATIEKVHASLKVIDSGVVAPETGDVQLKLSLKQAFKKDEVVCMVCGRGMKTLKRHLANAHGLKPGEYRKQFDIPSSQPLVAKGYSETRKQDALARGLGDNLAKARAVRAAKKAGKAAPVPAVKEKAAVPTQKAKAPVPAVRKKAQVPAKTK
ncbi:MucR family transcriptional regulator [Oryzomonas rubra]|uniref:MucR family transcriptional regulator n=1 Tax=Oryzomonas rubra TaxID=2509454 RepID=A0A5A9X4Q8_9BACT|nr:MucR family transcriptional regulator [Oryzomonas rubra]KAA0888132.1 MucR family transcriptional regulator [Oryzomonas rubra]